MRGTPVPSAARSTQPLQTSLPTVAFATTVVAPAAPGLPRLHPYTEVVHLGPCYGRPCPRQPLATPRAATPVASPSRCVSQATLPGLPPPRRPSRHAAPPAPQVVLAAPPFCRQCRARRTRWNSLPRYPTTCAPCAARRTCCRQTSTITPSYATGPAAPLPRRPLPPPRPFASHGMPRCSPRSLAAHRPPQSLPSHPRPNRLPSPLAHQPMLAPSAPASTLPRLTL
mmetsp:Transcript_8932/g.28526  ORF Transcript_8932/g.28526 Transcript_8932/m.28526 type:complete len:226 (-) Transcript_8932:84-761(-)